MIKLVSTISLCVSLASSAPAMAGDGWNHNHGGGIGPGAAVALGLGSFALGSALANPRAYSWPGYYPYLAPGYYASPYYPYPPPPRWCWSPAGSYPC